MDREDWGCLAAFAVVAEERSFTRAAARLGVSPSALSHTMRRLEERLRIQLLARSTRSVSTTEAGERLLARLGPAIEEISDAVEDLGRLLDRPSGHVRITASLTAARMVVAPVLPRFTKSYPEIVVETLIDPALTNIVAQRFDAGIRLGESLEKDVVAVPVTGPLRMAVAEGAHPKNTQVDCARRRARSRPNCAAARSSLSGSGGTRVGSAATSSGPRTPASEGAPGPSGRESI